MNHRLSIGLLMLGALAGCDRGCMSTERIVVKYHDRVALHEKAVTTRDGTNVGYVDEILVGKDLTRLLVRVKTASLFTDQDRFSIVKTKDGRGELQVVGGHGRHLNDGDEIDADPTFALKMKYALDRSPGGVTLPSGYYLPYPHALTADPAEREENAVKNMARMIEKRLRLRDQKVDRLPGDMRSNYNQLLDTLVGKSPDEVLRVYEDRGKPILDAAETLAQESQNTRDFETARQAKHLANKVQHIKEMAEREAHHMRGGPHTMPPEFASGEPPANRPVAERRTRSDGPRNPRPPKHAPRVPINESR